MNTSSSNARLRPFRPVPFGRYTLLSQLATGGMGEIFLARLDGMQGFEKLCVIKKILPQLAADPEFVERFLGEARTLVKLSHGSIAQVLDMGLHEDEAYMALEHVDGKDLRKVAARARDRQKALPPGFVLFVMGRVLDALAYAHRKRGDDEGDLNLVHRDISPQNILISYEGEVKVIDFGLAKSRLSAAKTNPSIILGKFLYMSPEQARHQPVDRRSDLYAVGLCLYELLSGKNPFDLLPPGELMSAVAHPDITPLGQVAPGLPPTLSQLVMKALAVEPAQRFQSAEELRSRLNHCMLELDPDAGPESISRYMHELFATEYMTERRMLVTLRDVGRAPEPEPVVIGMPEGVPPRPMPTLPPKTIRLDGPVEALSFKPTPRTREAGPGGGDGETRPAVVVDEPTRPAVALEALEESRRERLSPPYGSPVVGEPVDFPFPGAIAPTRELQVPPEPLNSQPPPAPLLEWVAMEAAGQQTAEDTPMWAEPLPTYESSRAPAPPREARSAPPPMLREEAPAPPAWAPPPARSAPPVVESPADDALPILSTDDLAPEVLGIALEDTQPRIQRPPPPRVTRQEPQPRASPDVYHQDTQPRVVLDESLLHDTEQEEVSASGRQKPATAPKPAVPRRRVTSTGMSVVVTPPPARSTSSNPRVTSATARDLRREEADRPTAASAPPVVQETAREGAEPPARSGRTGLIVGLVLLVVLVGGGVGALIYFKAHPERVPVSLRAQLLPLLGHKADGTPEEEEDLSQLKPLPRPTPAPVASPPPPEPEPVAVVPPPEDVLLTPLTPTEPEPTSKRPVRKRPARNQVLTKEWQVTRNAFRNLTNVVACDSLRFICGRYEKLKNEIEGGEETDEELLRRTRSLFRDIQAEQKRLIN